MLHLIFSSSEENKQAGNIIKKFNAIKEAPEFLPSLAYIFCIGGYFCGPHFSFKHFEKSLQRNRSEYLDIPFTIVLRKCLLALVLVLLLVPNTSYLSTRFVLETSQFLEMPYIQRVYYWTHWGIIVVMNYALVWTLAEGVVILSGIGFNGRLKGIYLLIHTETN